MSPEEAHWRNLGIHIGLQMRKPLTDPMHKPSPRERFKIGVRHRQGKQAMAAFLTPHPP